MGFAYRAHCVGDNLDLEVGHRVGLENGGW